MLQLSAADQEDNLIDIYIKNSDNVLSEWLRDRNIVVRSHYTSRTYKPFHNATKYSFDKRYCDQEFLTEFIITFGENIISDSEIIRQLKFMDILINDIKHSSGRYSSGRYRV